MFTMLHPLGFKAETVSFSRLLDPKLNSSGSNRSAHCVKLNVQIVFAELVPTGDEGDYPGRYYEPLPMPNRRSTAEHLATTMHKVPAKYKKRQLNANQEVWTPREVVSRVLALNHWEDIDGVLNCWLGRFNRKNFPALISVLLCLISTLTTCLSIPCCLWLFLTSSYSLSVGHLWRNSRFFC